MKKTHIGTFIVVVLTLPLSFILSGCRGNAGGGPVAISVLPAAAVPLTVSSTSPFNNGTSISPDAVITAKFSKAVKNLTQATFTLSDGMGNREGTLTLDPAGFVATFVPANPLALSTTYRATLSSGITDLENNPLTPLSWSFTTRDVVSWEFVDGNGENGLNYDVTKDTYFPQLTAFNSKLYAAWREMVNDDFQLRVAVYNGNDKSTAWTFVDGGGKTGINYDATQVAFDAQLTVFDARLYAIWQESTATGYQIRVAVSNGDDRSPEWRFVDGGGKTGINYNVAEGAGYPQLTAFGSKLYAIWEEEVKGSDKQIRVAVYNGNDKSPAWTFVDGNGKSGINHDVMQDVFFPQLTVLGSHLYATWRESNGTAYQIRVAVYNGNDSAPAWKFIDGNSANGINKDATEDGYYHQLTALSSKLYAIWQESNGTAYQIRVAVYNGDGKSPAWAFVDGNGAIGINKDATKDGYNPQLTVYGSKLYATWYELTDQASQIRVAVYNGTDNSPAWAFVDGNSVKGINHDATKDAFDPQLTVFGSRLYATWKEKSAAGHQVRAAVGH